MTGSLGIRTTRAAAIMTFVAIAITWLAGVVAHAARGAHGDYAVAGRLVATPVTRGAGYAVHGGVEHDVPRAGGWQIAGGVVARSASLSAAVSAAPDAPDRNGDGVVDADDLLDAIMRRPADEPIDPDDIIAILSAWGSWR